MLSAFPWLHGISSSSTYNARRTRGVIKLHVQRKTDTGCHQAPRTTQDGHGVSSSSTYNARRTRGVIKFHVQRKTDTGCHQAPRTTQDGHGVSSSSTYNARRTGTNCTIFYLLGASPLTGMDYHRQLWIGTLVGSGRA